MKKRVLIGTIAAGIAAASPADPVFYDTFDNGDLATGSGPSINAGFKEIDNGGPGNAGSVEETGGAAVLTSGSTKNVYGLLSLNPVSLSNPAGFETAWQVEGYDLKDNAAYLAFTWQASPDYDDTPDLMVVLNMTNGQITVTSNGTVVDDSQTFDVNVFDGPTNSFSLIATYTPAILDLKAEVNNSGIEDIDFYHEWSSVVPLKSDVVYHHGAFVNGEGNEAITAAIDYVVTVHIPEPTVVSLISLFGGGMIFSRRIFGRKKSGSGA